MSSPTPLAPTTRDRPTGSRWPSTAAVDHAPGLLAAAALATIAIGLNRALPVVSALTIAIVLGVILGNRAGTERLRPGLHYASRSILRAGVVMLGYRLSVDQIGELGATTIGVVVATVTATFFGTRWLGPRLGVSEPLSLLIATGWSICGASAIAAMESTSDAEEEEVAAAVGLVTFAGTVAMFLLPLLGSTFGLTGGQFGIWVGASVHDVAQVVAAASTGGSAVLSIAVVVKLTRVVLLAPLVAGVGITRNRLRPDDRRSRPPLVPGFVIGFLVLVGVRTADVLPEAATGVLSTAEGALLAVALVGLGAGVRIERFRSLGGAPVALAAMATLLVGTVSLLAVLVVPV